MLWNEVAETMNGGVWPERLYGLDVSRGLAALSVVLWHWHHFAYTGTSLSQDFVPESQPLYGILRPFYEQGGRGVGYFFLLSGFLFFWLYRKSIQDRSTSAWTFAVKRFSRLYPLHLVTLLAVAILQLLYFTREASPYVYAYNDLYHFGVNLAFASGWGLEQGWSFNAPVWTVSIEVLLYMFFFLMAFFRRGGWLFCLSVVLVSFVATLFSYYAPFRGLAYFFLGGLVFYATVWISTKRQALRVIVYVLTILAWSGVVMNYYLFDITSIVSEWGVAGRLLQLWFPAYVLFPLSVCSLALVEIEIGAFLKPVAWVGDITYSSYLLQFPLQLLFALAVSYNILSSDFYMEPLYLVLYFSILILLSILVFRKFERPMKRAIRNNLLRLQKA